MVYVMNMDCVICEVRPKVLHITSFAYAMCVWFRTDRKINTDYFRTPFNEWFM